MKQIRIETGNDIIDFSLPEEWNELSNPQLYFLIRLLGKNVSAEEVKLKMFLKSVDGKIKKRNTDGSFRTFFGKKRVDLLSSEVVAIGKCFDFLFMTVSGQVQVNPEITRNRLPRIRSFFSVLHGPDDGLTNLKYSEFAELQVAHGDRDMDAFFSILYRTNKKHVKRIPKIKKTLVVWFYLGCLSRLRDLFPHVFQSDGSGEATSPADGQMRIIDALAKNDVTKKEAVRNSDLYEALYTMEIAAEQYEEMKKKK